MTWEIVPQDKAWVKQAKRNLTALYENQPLERMPFEWHEFQAKAEFDEPNQDTISAQQAKSVEQVKRDFFDIESDLRGQLKSIADRVHQGFWDDRILCLHPIGPVTCWMAEVFGTKIRWFSNRPCFSEPIVSEVQQIDSLQPNFAKAELYQLGLKQMRFFRTIVKDRIPVSSPDLQSPVSVASMIMDYAQLIYAMIDDPVRVHALMRMITDATIKACHTFRREMVTDYPMTQFDWWMPRGIFLSDDLMSVLSPDLYMEFALPYNEILSEEFGGLGLHCCGISSHNLENVAQTKGILAMNTTDRLSDVAPIIKNRLALILGGIFEVILPSRSDSKRSFIKDAESLEEYWWEDAGRIAEIKGQRFLYQCHALLYKHTANEAYERMLALSQKAAAGLRQKKYIS